MPRPELLVIHERQRGTVEPRRGGRTFLSRIRPTWPRGNLGRNREARYLASGTFTWLCRRPLRLPSPAISRCSGCYHDETPAGGQMPRLNVSRRSQIRRSTLRRPK